MRRSLALALCVMGAAAGCGGSRPHASPAPARLQALTRQLGSGKRSTAGAARVKVTRARLRERVEQLLSAGHSPGAPHATDRAGATTGLLGAAAKAAAASR